MARYWLPSLVLSSLPVLLSVGCSGGGNPDSIPLGPGEFESADPTGRNNSRGGLNAGAPSGSGGTSSAGEDAAGDGNAGRAIEEADIIKIVDNRLYALSQYGGLNVIDIGTRDRLRLLGRKKVQAQPFEMYVRGSIVFALYNGYGEYVRDEAKDTWSWINTSYVIAFDTTQPDNIQIIGRFAVPGEISDSRIVGDVLYVVGFQNGYCWGCSSQQQTTIISLNVANPGAIAKVDELTFAESTQGYSWRRSVTATDQRMYVAGPEWGTNEPVGSQIQVVDISDPTGDLKEGTTVKVEGQIASRWQMDEHAGVLRVVSQKGSWRPTSNPKVQTFTVASSQSIAPLGATDLIIPQGEDLRSARFDGPRGYAITALQTDPLFTIDLADPKNPKQAGELEMPGWVYHMEPRGDRVLALGFDQGNAAGGLHVSLFDVSNLASPTMLSRVNFGGDWASVSEDQDRIHKAFNIMPDAGLILMPFAGWSRTDPSGEYCYGKYTSGIQLIDWANDKLELRAVAPAYGQARRGFIHDSRLFAVSDERVETFNVDDRNLPQKTASLKMANYVSKVVPAGDKVIRVAQNWWTNITELEVTLAALAENPLALGRIEIPDVEQSRCYGGSWLRDVLVQGNRAYVIYNMYNYAQDAAGYKPEHSTRVLTLDISDPAEPKGIGDAILDFGEGWNYSYIPGVYDQGRGIVAVGSSLVVLSSDYTYDAQGYYVSRGSKLRVVDMSDANAPVVTELALPPNRGTTGLHVSGDSVAFGHYEDSQVNSGRVRFYVDRLNLADPRSPTLASSVNVPGSIVAYDAAAGRVFTVDYRHEVEPGLTSQQCYEKYAYAQFEPQTSGVYWDQNTRGTCTGVLHSLRLVALGGTRAELIGSVDLSEREQVGNIAIGDDRLFVNVSGNNYYYGGVADCFDCGYYGGGANRDLNILALSGLKSGIFGSGRLTVKGGDFWSYSPMAAAGTRVVLSTGWRGKLSVIAADQVSAPSVVREAEVFGYVSDITAVGNLGLASMGYDGVQTIRLND